jgi:hypothetical protein
MTRTKANETVEKADDNKKLNWILQRWTNVAFIITQLWNHLQHSRLAGSLTSIRNVVDMGALSFQPIGYESPVNQQQWRPFNLHFCLFLLPVDFLSYLNVQRGWAILMTDVQELSRQGEQTAILTHLA